MIKHADLKVKVPDKFDSPKAERDFWHDVFQDDSAIRNHYKDSDLSRHDRFLKFLYEQSFFHFFKYIMFTPEDQWRVSDDVHYKGCRFIADPASLYKLMILFRKGMKSSMLRGFCIHDLINNPTDRFMYYTGQITLASKNLRNIGRQLRFNEALHKYWKHMKVDESHMKNKMWNSSGIEVPIPSTLVSPIHNEASIEIGSVESGVSGLHYDRVIADDIVNNKNYRTAKLRANVKDAFNELYSIKLDTGYMYVIGTRWHYDDVYGTIIKDQEDNDLDISEESRKKYTFTIYHRKAVEQGRVVYPEVLNHDVLEVYKKKLGLYMYSCQYLCEPVSPENAIFDMTKLRFITQKELRDRVKQVYCYVLIDAIVFESKTGDDNLAIVVAEVDTERNIFVRRCILGRFSDKKMIAELQKFYDVYRVDPRIQSLKFAMGEAAFQTKYRKYIEQEMREKRIGFRIQGVPESTGRTKGQHIASMAPFIENGQVFFVVKDSTDVKALDPERREDVLKALPHELAEMYKGMEVYHPDSAEHDDAEDAFALLRHFVMKAKEVPTSVPRDTVCRCRRCFRMYDDLSDADLCPNCGDRIIRVLTDGGKEQKLFTEMIEDMDMYGDSGDGDMFGNVLNLTGTYN